MSKYYKIDAEEMRGIRIKANADSLVEKEGVKGYAMMWLNLTNNQKANKKSIWKVYNDYDNGVYVVCDAESDNVEAVIDYLERLGLVIEYKAEIVAVMPDEVIRDDDMDTELIDW